MTFSQKITNHWPHLTTPEFSIAAVIIYRRKHNLPFEQAYYLLKPEEGNNYVLQIYLKFGMTNLEILEVRSFSLDHLCQQLVLKPISGDSEVDKSGLCLHLRLVVGIGQLRVQYQLESGVILYFLISYFDGSVKYPLSLVIKINSSNLSYIMLKSCKALNVYSVPDWWVGRRDKEHMWGGEVTANRWQTVQNI